jgi:hypothetical protein
MDLSNVIVSLGGMLVFGLLLSWGSLKMLSSVMKKGVKTASIQNMLQQAGIKIRNIDELVQAIDSKSCDNETFQRLLTFIQMGQPQKAMAGMSGLGDLMQMGQMLGGGLGQGIGQGLGQAVQPTEQPATEVKTDE